MILTAASKIFEFLNNLFLNLSASFLYPPNTFSDSYTTQASNVVQINPAPNPVTTWATYAKNLDLAFLVINSKLY